MVSPLRHPPPERSAQEELTVYRELSRDVLLIVHEGGDPAGMVQRVIAALRTRLSFDAVGMRLRCGEDFPYLDQQGFSEDFLRTENTLLARAKDGSICRHPDGSAQLECTCGLILSGRTDPHNPLFTHGGSFWTNDSQPLLNQPATAELRLNPRNRCIHLAYASVALIPVRSRTRIVGLLQLNDRNPGRFSLEAIEILEGMAAHLGSALQRREDELALRQAHDELERKVEERTTALREAYESLAREIAERQRAELRSRQLQKTESLRRMAGAVAHHFNNQMQAVLLSLEMTAGTVPLELRLEAGLDTAMQAARKAAAISAMMQLYLGETFSPRHPLDLAALCRRCLDELERELPAGVLAGSQLPEPGPRICADGEQIRQVIRNLVINAQEATDGRAGSVRVTVSTVTPSEIAANCSPLDFRAGTGMYACIAIADTGCGIAQKEVEKLFDPFYTTKFTGRGMGLPIVLGLVQAHDGAIAVDSELNRGSIFRIYLPVAPPA